MATMGLLSSSILGSIFIFIGRTLGLSDTEEILEQKDTLNGKNKIRIFADFRIFIINLGFSGLAISFGVFITKLSIYYLLLSTSLALIIKFKIALEEQYLNNKFKSYLVYKNEVKY